jgi:hypothetical protein
MGLRKQDAQELDRVVRHPSLTLLTMTTPSTLYEGISSASVLDGFLGRFVIVESPLGRKRGQKRRKLPPTERLLEWANACASVKTGNLDADSHDIPPAPIDVPFEAACDPLLDDFEDQMIAEMDAHDRLGLDAMFGRTREIAMRIALIVAVSRGESAISTDSLRWALDYAGHYARRAVASLKVSMADGPHSRACKAVMAKIEKAGLRGITESELSGAIRLYEEMKPLERRAVMDTLVADHGIECRNMSEGKRGRPRLAWFMP